MAFAFSCHTCDLDVVLFKNRTIKAARPTILTNRANDRKKEGRVINVPIDQEGSPRITRVSAKCPGQARSAEVTLRVKHHWPLEANPRLPQPAGA